MSGTALQGRQADALPSQPPVLPADLALMVDLLGQAPVMFHRPFVGICGSIHAALWLSWAMTRRARALAQQSSSDQPEAGPPEPVWFATSRDDCEEGTGLTRYQQESARRELRERGLVLERRRGTTMIAIDTRRLGQMLREQSTADWASLTAIQPPAAPDLAASAGVTG